jgi:aryl-alcohol dehydrogenase-like predicted oxidoreductase
MVKGGMACCIATGPETDRQDVADHAHQDSSVDVPMRLCLKNGPTSYRLGLGAIRITCPGAWGQPRCEGEEIALLRHAVDRGVNCIDTGDFYRPEVSETLIAEALQPDPAGLVIAGKGEFTRLGPAA